MDYENGSIPYLLKLTAKEAFITLIKKVIILIIWLQFHTI